MINPPWRLYIGIFRGPPIIIPLKGHSNKRRLVDLQIAIMYENVKQNQVTEKGTEIRSVFAYGEQAGIGFGKEGLLRIAKDGHIKISFFYQKIRKILGLVYKARGF